MTSNEFIMQNIKNMFNNSSSIFVIPNIPEKKLNNAIRGFKVENYKHIVALYDNTIFGAGDNGLVFTGEKLIARSIGDKNPTIIFYKDIKYAKYSTIEKEIKPGKIKKEEHIDVILSDEPNKKISLNYMISNIDYKHLETFINALIKECDIESFKNEDMLIPIQNMSENLKLSYIKIVVALTSEISNEINPSQLADIFQLIDRLNLEKENRLKLRNFIVEGKDFNALNVKDLLETIREEYPSHFKNIKISIIKDLIILQSSQSMTIERSESFKTKCNNIFEISGEEIDVIYDAIENDYKLLKEDIEDDVFKKTIKDIGAKAAGIGVPLGAVYLSGTIGLSAVGMTSGLASLGLGGLLGFSSMATGIGMAVLLGIGAYQGVKYITSDNAVSKYKQRGLMLHEIIKSMQKTISVTIEDINFIVEKLNLITDKSNEQREKIIKLLATLNITNQKMKDMQIQQARIRCPKIISINRLENITTDETKKEIFDFIIQFYDKNGDDFILQNDISLENLEKIASYLESIGYFKNLNILKDKTAPFFKNAFNSK